MVSSIRVEEHSHHKLKLFTHTEVVLKKNSSSSIPTKDQLLEPKVVTDVPSSVVTRHLEAKKFYDKEQNLYQNCIQESQ